MCTKDSLCTWFNLQCLLCFKAVCYKLPYSGNNIGTFIGNYLSLTVSHAHVIFHSNITIYSGYTVTLRGAFDWMELISFFSWNVFDESPVLL